MPKILRIMHRLSISGPTHQAYCLTKYLPPRFETLLVAGNLESDEVSPEFLREDADFQVTYLPNMRRSLNLLNDLRTFWALRQLIRQYKPDIVHTHAAKAGALGRLAAWTQGVPVIVHTFHGHVFHSYFGKWQTRFFLWVERRLAKVSTAIIAISPLQKKELTETYRICPAEKIRVVPLGFDLQPFITQQTAKRQSFRQEFQLAESTVAFGFVGRLTAVKDAALFVRAFAALHDLKGDKVKAFIVGDGELKTVLLQLAHSLGIETASTPIASAAMYFTSWRNDMDRVMSGLDIIALTSLNEGTPVSLIEAQAAGLPIIATQVGGVADVVAANPAAQLIQPKDEKALIAAMVYAFEHPTWRLGAKDYASTAVQRYDYQRLLHDIAALYDSLLPQSVRNA